MTDNVAKIDDISRNKNIKINIYAGFIIKFSSIGISFLVIPITISFLSAQQYGIWLTLLSVVSWMSFFDMGLGNGLRNRLTASLSEDNINNAREYISTAYVVISIIVFCISIVSIISIQMINWNKFFNTDILSNSEFIYFVSIVLIFILLNFVFSLYNQLFYAIQKSYIIGIGQLVLNLLLLINISAIKFMGKNTLPMMALCYGIALLFTSIYFTAYFFILHPELLPNYKFINKSKVKDIMGIGVKFFIIQISFLIIYTTDNFIITQVLGPEHVISYSLVFKVFSIITMGSTIVLSPLWSAYTEAFVKGDVQWIRRTLRRLNLFMLPLILTVCILIIFAKNIIDICINPSIYIPNYLIIFVGIYTILLIWSNIYSYFLNGVGQVNISTVVAVLQALINIPLSIYLGNKIGSAGVVLASVICLLFSAVQGPIQTYYILASNSISRSGIKS